ncbi:MAG TPA: hypothetical protein DDW49_10950 [Deltaproteobacteria bacterium]|nr:MAG: hypothetical protein A2048_01905 [Deltaproteobacteria bacterium GWA2_45_12]HBF13882.1 hypothetical protein [Deltaproteobacteria bacterium]
MGTKFTATYNNQEIPIEVEELGKDSIKIKSGEKQWVLDVHKAGFHHYSVVNEHKSYDLRFFHKDSNVDAFWDGEHLSFKLEDQRAILKRKASGKEGAGHKLDGPVEIAAMMPGKIVAVKVKKGDKVSEGQGIVILEAMKMENELTSPKNGVVVDVRANEGQSVESGSILVVVE